MTSLNIHRELHVPITGHTLDYRSDIDGLRALAVLSVVAFHAFPMQFPGGLIGVDIFFVISGYLITSIIKNELASSAFSIREFYVKRIIRLFPALLAMLTFCLVFGWLALLSNEYQSLAKHILGGVGFVANIQLWLESSYFDVAAETKPLLHLWSLGIEEQFYLIWPLALAALWKTRKNLFQATLFLLLASLLTNLYLSPRSPIEDFFAPYTRAWELFVGALIGLSVHRLPFSKTCSNSLSILGLMATAAGLAVIRHADGYPGALALLPVTGAALLIAAGPGGIINRTFLSSRSMVAVGLISYPLYLWHWPLLVFPRVIESSTPPAICRVLAVALALVLAWLTYKFVESPIRKNRNNRNFKALALLSAALALAGAAWIVVEERGFPAREGANPVAHFADDLGRDPYVTYMSNHFFRCHDETLKKMSKLDPQYGYRCFQSKPSGPIDILVLGDSHAEHLLLGLAEQFKNLNVSSLNQSELPIINGNKFEGTFQYVANDPSIKTVIISALWGFKIIPSMDGISQKLTETLNQFNTSNKKLFVFEDIPAFSFDPEKCKYGRRFASTGTQCTEILKTGKDSDQFYLTPLLEAIAANGRATFVPVRKYFCAGDACRMNEGSSLLYRDSNHLSLSGSRYLARKLVEDKALDARNRNPGDQ